VQFVSRDTLDSRKTACSLLQDEALRAFVEPETLDGSNQYFCEKCARKCDAHKVSFIILSFFHPLLVILTNKFGDDQLRGLGLVGAQILLFPIDFASRPYNSATLPHAV